MRHKLHEAGPTAIELLQTANSDALADILESIECFINLLNIYISTSPTQSVNQIVVELIMELISMVALLIP